MRGLRVMKRGSWVAKTKSSIHDPRRGGWEALFAWVRVAVTMDGVGEVSQGHEKQVRAPWVRFSRVGLTGTPRAIRVLSCPACSLPVASPNEGNTRRPSWTDRNVGFVFPKEARSRRRDRSRPPAWEIRIF